MFGIGYSASSGKNYLKSFDPSTGRVRYSASFSFDSGGWYANSLVATSTDVYAVSAGGKLYDFDAATGVLKSSSISVGYIQALAKSSKHLIGILYDNATKSNYLKSFDPDTGYVNYAKKFSFPWYFGSFTVTETDVYLISGDGKLYDFNATTGSLKSDSVSVGSVRALAASGDDLVCVIYDAATGKQYLRLFNPSTGVAKYSTEISLDSSWSPDWFASNATDVYLRTVNGTIYNFDAANGSLKSSKIIDKSLQDIAVIEALFTLSDDFVNFNDLDAVKNVFASAGIDNARALGGNDTVILPTTAQGLANWGLKSGFYGGEGNDTISGGGGRAFVYGDAGDDTFIVSDAELPATAATATAVALYDGGAGKNTADFSSATKGVTGRIIDEASQAAKGLNFIDTGAFIGSSGMDTLSVSGGTKENLSFDVHFVLAGDHVDLTTTEVFFSHGKADSAQPAMISLKGIEKVVFAGGINNAVNLSSSGQSIAVEMLRLADEVYGPQATHFFKAEPLAYDPATNPAWNLDVGKYAKARGWHEVAALELGIAPADDGAGKLHYSFVNGFYQAISDKDMPIGQSEANALVLSGVVGGKKTLSIAFRGTDQVADMFDYSSFSTHYAKFAPLIAAIRQYLTDNPDVSEVLISGHSLGAAMAEYLTADLSVWGNTAGHSLQTYTMGSPGAEVAAPGNDMLNIINTGDVVSALGELSADADARALATAAAMTAAGALFGAKDFLAGVALKNPRLIIEGLLDGYEAGTKVNDLLNSIQPKPRDGAVVRIDTDITYWLLGTAEHASNLYVDEVKQLNVLARAGGPFANTQLAQSLIANTIYRGGEAFSGEMQISMAVPEGFSADAARADYDSRYSTGFGGTVTAHEADVFVLGTPGQDDSFVFANPLFLAATRDMRVFDGYSDGTAQGDQLTLLRPESWFSVGDATADGGREIRYSFGNHTLIGTIYNIEKLVFLDGADRLDGQAVSVQRPTLTAGMKAAEVVIAKAAVPVFRLSGRFDYADAGDGVMTVLGTRGANILYMGSGSKTVKLSDGADVVIVKGGLAGDRNIIDGGIGADVMSGGAGNETYIVDSAGDTVNEAAGGGRDTVKTTLSAFTLPDNVEALVFIGSETHAGTGNTLGNAISGGAGSEVLLGLGGNDVLTGGAGTDVLSGGDGVDVLRGGAGDDRLIGGAGSDVLTGDAGADTFVFDVLDGARDRVTDFVHGLDKIALSTAAFSALTGFGQGVLDVDELKLGTFAGTASDHLIYSQARGALFYDADGSGSGKAVLIAQFAKGLALDAGDFVLV